MVMYRKIPSSVFRDAGYQSKKDAIEHLASLHVSGHKFEDVAALSAYMTDLADKPEKALKEKPKRAVESRAAAATMASIDDESEEKDPSVEVAIKEDITALFPVELPVAKAKKPRRKVPPKIQIEGASPKKRAPRLLKKAAAIPSEA